MSKSLSNYPDVNEVFERDGADAMRWFLMSSPVLRGGNLVVTEQGIRDGVRQVMIPLWNVWYFFSLYANAANGGAGYDAAHRTTSPAVLDRYLLAKTRDLVADVTARMDTYDIAGANASVREFLDVLTNWYVRRSRERFWAEDAAAFDTLYTVLETLTRLTAPLLPLVSEEIWRGLTGGRSVHLTDWPASTGEGALPGDDALVASMDRAREVASATLGLRKAQNLRVRQPLRRLTVVSGDVDALGDFTGVVADEVNVKEVRLLALGGAPAAELGVTERLTVNARAAGPRLGRDVQAVIRAAKAGDWSQSADGVVTCGGVVLEPGEYGLETVVSGDAGHAAVAVLPGGGFVVLDTELDAELEAEGWVRDVIRQVQDARKAADLHVADKIRLSLTVPDRRWETAKDAMQLIMGETLAIGVGIDTHDAEAVAVGVEKA
jgi:isoleucyl-tRNA synthetase